MMTFKICLIYSTKEGSVIATIVGYKKMGRFWGEGVSKITYLKFSGKIYNKKG